jgi:hypothetical protein
MFFPALERQLARESDGGTDMLQQLKELLSNRQPFSLHGVELEGLGGVTATLVFRWVRCSHVCISQVCVSGPLLCLLHSSAVGFA